MKFDSSLLAVLAIAGLLSGCGNTKVSIDPATDAPPCGETFIENYNAVSVWVRQVKEDLDRAYGESRPTDPKEAELAREVAYRDAQACRAQAVSFRTRYNGVKCVALVEDKNTVVDATQKMDEVIKAMDQVPVP